MSSYLYESVLTQRFLNNERGSILTLSSTAESDLGLSTAYSQLSAAQYAVFKRCFDFFGAFTLLLLASPLLLIVSVLVKLTSPGPVFYVQQRQTIGGRIFRMIKFRSMTVNAETGSGAVFASKGDVRITPIGRYLRTFRIDELPQLINVLRGDMSLIGPRPERPEVAVKLQDRFPEFVRRLEVKAGLTGLAQVYAPYADSEESYRNKLRYDSIYVDKRGILLDLLIALKTVSVVLTGKGAQ